MAGGFSAASFYVPSHAIKKWSWETYWISLGFVAWLIMPTVAGADHAGPLGHPAPESGRQHGRSVRFGDLWGFGGLMCGLALRYLGLSLGQSISLGVCSIVGTLVPATIEGKIGLLFTTLPGFVVRHVAGRRPQRLAGREGGGAGIAVGDQAGLGRCGIDLLRRASGGLVAAGVMKNWKFLLLAVLGVALSVFFLAIMRPPGGRSSTPRPDLPWQATASPDGATLTVFGLTLGQSTVADAVNKLGRRYELGLFQGPDGDLSWKRISGTRWSAA